MRKFYDLEFERMANDCICLTQSCGVDEPNVILAHPEQLLYIARQLCGLKPETANQVADLERRIGVLVDKLQRIVCNDYFRKDLLDECADGFEHLAKLDAVLDLALEYDGGRLKPEYPDDEQPERPSTSKPITPCATTGETMKAQPSPVADSGEQLGLLV